MRGTRRHRIARYLLVGGAVAISLNQEMNMAGIGFISPIAMYVVAVAVALVVRACTASAGSWRSDRKMHAPS